MSLKTPLGRVRGYGSAKDGTHHWWMQRLTALALVPLVLWLVVSLLALIGADQATVRAWVAAPLHAVPLLLLLLAGFYHMKLGLQVVIEDYFHTPWLKLTLLILNGFGAAVLAAIAVFSVLRIAFGPA